MADLNNTASASKPDVTKSVPQWNKVYEFNEPVTNMAVLTVFKPRWWELWKHQQQELYISTTGKNGYSLYKYSELTQANNQSGGEK